MPLTITGEQLADYIVCPESWRLKYIVGSSHERSENFESRSLKHEWTAGAELRQQLRKYTKIIFSLLAFITGGILLLDSFGFTPLVTRNAAQQHRELSSSSVPTEIGLLLLVVGLLIFIWDLFDRRATNLQQQSGLTKNTELLSAKGSTMLPAKVLRSKSSKLYSKPFALLKESKNTIPVDVYPTTTSVRDRHVLPLILHLFLLESAGYTRPPYGVLLMGRKRKRIQIANTDEKRRWLQSVIDEMRSIEDGVPAIPSPTPRKCKNCDVQNSCAYRVLTPKK